ncbi:MAG: phospholipid carrier-dependent glycosyltransferase [Candidatus Zixiibacteriota bacterium]|nr:MAG: phospholipid carrier-dependent glycosyltransferase [candidate division Zixibacteria bacterium]
MNIKEEHSKYLPLFIFLLISILYILTMPAKFIIQDSAAEIRLALSEHPGIRSSHLLTTPLFGLLLRLDRLFGLGDNSFIIVQILNIMLSIGCAVILYLMLKRLLRDRNSALYLVLFFSISNVVWNQSIAAETGMLSQVCLTLSLYFLLNCISARGNRYFSAAVSLGFVSIGVLFSTYMAIFVPFTLVILWVAVDRSVVSRAKIIIIMSSTLLFFMAMPFLIGAYLDGVDSISGFLKWMTTHSEQDRLSGISILRPESIFRAAAGIVSTFVDTRGGLTYVKLLARGEPIVGIPATSLIYLAVGLLITVSVFSLSIRGIAKNRKGLLVYYCIFNLILLFIFNLFWLGSDPQFWMPGLPLLLILSGYGIVSIKQSTISKVLMIFFKVGLLSGLLIINTPRDLPSIAFPDGGDDLKRAKLFAEDLQEGDVIFSPGWNWTEYIVNLRRDVRLVNLVYSDEIGRDESFYVDLDNIILKTLADDKKVYFEGLSGPKTARQYGAWQMFENHRGLSREEVFKYLDTTYKIRHIDDREGKDLILLYSVK